MEKHAAEKHVEDFVTLVSKVQRKGYERDRYEAALRILAAFAVSEPVLERTSDEIASRVAEAYRWADALLAGGAPKGPSSELDERRRRDHEDIAGVPNEEA